MQKSFNIIEITNTQIRLLVGASIDEKPIVFYKNEVTIEGLITRGEIVDTNTLVSVLKKMKHYRINKTDYTVDEATLVLPPIGFEVFQDDKTTNVVSSTSVIENIDIQNVLSLVQKQQIPGESELIDIVPDVFTLEDKSQFYNAPLGKKSNSLNLRCKIHTLPRRVVSGYKELLSLADIHVRRVAVSNYAASVFLREAKQYPKDYILIDGGACSTNITLVASNAPIGSTTVLYGGNDLTIRIADEFGVDVSKANEIKELYGLTGTKLLFNPVIAQSVDSLGINVSYTPDELNGVINNFLDAYLAQIKNALLTLQNAYGAPDNLPFIFTGGFMELRGIKKVIEKYFSNNKIYFVAPKTIGVRNAKYTATVGALLISSIYRGNLSDQAAKISAIDRVDNK